MVIPLKSMSCNLQFNSVLCTSVLYNIIIFSSKNIIIYFIYLIIQFYDNIIKYGILKPRHVHNILILM